MEVAREWLVLVLDIGETYITYIGGLANDSRRINCNKARCK
jgi:hypothetical protein